MDHKTSEAKVSKHNENQVKAKGQQEDIQAYLHIMAEEDMYHKKSIIIRWSNLNQMSTEVHSLMADELMDLKQSQSCWDKLTCKAKGQQ